jgi:hypothetical protein
MPTEVSELKGLPAEVGPVLALADRTGDSEKIGHNFVTDEERTSDGEGSVVDADAVEDRGESY